MSQLLATGPLAASLRPLLNQVPHVLGAVLLTPPDQTTVLRDSAADAPALEDVAPAAHRLLVHSRDFDLDTRWLRLAADRGTLYAIGATNFPTLVLLTGESRLSSHWLEQLVACLRHAPRTVA